MSFDLGEIVQDGEGTLMVVIGATAFLAFGTDEIIFEDNPKVVHPLTVFADASGNIVADKINYPNGSVFR